MKNQSKSAFAFMTSVAATLVVASAAVLLAMQPAAATVKFAKDTGKSCGDCHTKVQGGGPLTPLGEEFKTNGNKMSK